jgi:putative ribosome biogenesis GTPase RsgA
MFGQEFYKIPIVICLNKYDLAYNLKIHQNDFIDKVDIYLFKNISVVITSAISGKGVIRSFNELIGFIFPQLTLNLTI